METNITQLKQEQVINNDIVYEDILPKTSTGAVINEQNGTSLDETLSIIWNSINKKLSRIVNSVNGRTGVVILSSTDVGLSKVDNVSFSEIKQWVLDQLKKAFNNRRLQLVDSLHDIDELCATNDESFVGVPFYSSHGYNGDLFPHIGYIYLDEGTNSLTFNHLPIHVVTHADSSIIFNEVVGSKDYTDGQIGINIAPGEEALKIKEDPDGDKSKGGLYIDQSKLGGSLYAFDGVYGTGDPTDPDALFYCGDDIPTSAPKVRVYMDDRFLVSSGLRLKKTDLNLGNLILCRFRDYRSFDDQNNPVVPTGMFTQLMHKNTCLGIVKEVVNPSFGTDYYRMDFYSIRPLVGWGLKYKKDSDSATTFDSIVIDLASYRYDFHPTSVAMRNVNVNLSGLQITENTKRNLDTNEPSNHQGDEDAENTTINLPQGPTTINYSGLGVSTDPSLSIIPFNWYGKGTELEGYSTSNNTGSRVVANWRTPQLKYYNTEHTEYEDGVAKDYSLLGINLIKTVQTAVDYKSHYSGSSESAIDEIHNSDFRFSNISGLRVNDATYFQDGSAYSDSGSLDYEWFGMRQYDPEDEERVGESKVINSGVADGFLSMRHSGGLSVNVGKFLEIEPGRDFPETADEYYNKTHKPMTNPSQGGKINVRLGKGLKEESIVKVEDGEIYPVATNRITLDIADTLAFDENNRLTINEDLNVKVKTKILEFVDMDGTTFEYNPTGQTTENQEKLTIRLGNGLKIYTVMSRSTSTNQEEEGSGD